MKNTISAAQAATMLGVTPCRIRQLIYAGKLKAKKVGGTFWVVDKLSVKAFDKVRPPRGNPNFVKNT